ncbi:kelch repeat and BTB domain-containing protein 2-like [Branchiostoma floridae]|uniref:Kelch repeat and BTB domain-containing protein 2-like n=1 Tax=Branchiostoma floridae TaxID=7739 RepID=A0A9J7N3C5_BRAFL|nr:kelch repeat and BTB domain-containing protein 2-like [Branchiostoma floridae]
MVENMKVERSTCVDLYKFAEVFSVDIVHKQCLQWIVRHFTEVASSEKFCSLSVNQLTEIISHDELDVKEETTVWEAVVRWVQHSREDRQHHLPSILPHIRFNLLTPDDTAAILEHPLVKEDPGSSEVIRNVVPSETSNLKPRLGMTTEMVMLHKSTNKLFSRSNELLFMNPQKGKYISCSYRSEDIPDDVVSLTVTSDNNIYILTESAGEDDDDDDPDSFHEYLYHYNQARNVWVHAGIPKISIAPTESASGFLVEVDQILYFLAEAKDGDGIQHVRLRKYNRHTDQWQECLQLELDRAYYCCKIALSCDRRLYYIMDKQMYCYDPRQDTWSERTPPCLEDVQECFTAVAMGTEIFYTNSKFHRTMVYDTELDYWTVLHGWPGPGKLCRPPYLFALEDQLHIFVEVSDNNREGSSSQYRVYVYDRSVDYWRDLKATLPDETYYYTYGSCAPVARMYLPYLQEI